MRVPRAETERLDEALQALFAAERKRLDAANRDLTEARQALDAGLPVFQPLHDDGGY